MPRNLLHSAATILLLSAAAFAQRDPDRKEWIQLFNGKNLDGWVPKITGFPLGENYGNSGSLNEDVIRPFAKPLMEKAGFLVVGGNLFDSALVKTSVIGEDFRARQASVRTSEPTVARRRPALADRPRHLPNIGLRQRRYPPGCSPGASWPVRVTYSV